MTNLAHLLTVSYLPTSASMRGGTDQTDSHCVADLDAFIHVALLQVMMEMLSVQIWLLYEVNDRLFYLSF